MVAQRLHPVDCSVATDAYQAIDLEPLEPCGHFLDGFEVVGVDVVPRRAQDRSSARGVEFRDGLIQGIQVNVRHKRVEQAAETLDDSDHFHAGAVGLRHHAGDCRVERGGISPGRQDTDPLHPDLCRAGDVRSPAKSGDGEWSGIRRRG